MNLDLTKITDIEFDGIDHKDYPDYCNSYISSAYYIDRPLTETELEYIQENHGDWVYEKLMNYLH